MFGPVTGGRWSWRCTDSACPAAPLGMDEGSAVSIPDGVAAGKRHLRVVHGYGAHAPTPLEVASFFADAPVEAAARDGVNTTSRRDPASRTDVPGLPC